MTNVKTGITLFSLGTPYLKGELDLEGVIRAAAELGAQGYEIVAAQMIPSYPYVTDEFAEFIRQCTEKYGIGPICYAANMDRGMLKDRDLTEDEQRQLDLSRATELQAALDALENATKIVEVSSLKNFFKGTPE